MSDKLFEMRFDPQTIKHLGLSMYSKLAPALSEIISNAYDADANKVVITLIEDKERTPIEIKIEDNGTGLSFSEINDKFLIIGRNRRDNEGDTPSVKYKRLPTGKKGLGKLALFGIAKTITVTTIQDNKKNQFILDWDDLMSAKGSYHPRAIITDQDIKSKNGTTISMTGLKRKTSFNLNELADSLSRIFLFDENFTLQIKTSSKDIIAIDNKRKYSLVDKEFEWNIEDPYFIPTESEYSGKIKGELLTSEKPIRPSSGLRGVTLFSRGKLVNAPEFFSNSTSSNFYEYLTGWLTVDFIDLIEEDVIATNRQSIDWEHPEMIKLRKFLSGIISQINIDWRKRRKEKKTKDLDETTGINTENWVKTMPEDVKKSTEQILNILSGEDTFERYTPVIKALHDIVPEYPYYHWRHLHQKVQEKSKEYYVNQNYYTAFIESVKKYTDEVKTKSGHNAQNDYNLMAAVFKEQGGILKVIGDYKKRDGKKFSDQTVNNVQSGQQHLSQGIIAGGRNPVSHEEIEELRTSGLFSEKDCLDMLSLLSHLFKRLDKSIK